MFTAKSRFTMSLLAAAIVASGLIYSIWAHDTGASSAARADSSALVTDEQVPTTALRQRVAQLKSVPPGPAPPGKVWSAEHGHWHDQKSPPQAAPGPTPPGKVWSAEHGHWHDQKPPSQAAPGPAPAGKVWSAEHGHWHDLDAASQSESATAVPKKDQILFKLPDLEGNLVSSSDEKFGGKVLLLDIWGTWCPPCRVEVPHLVRLYEKYRDQGLEIVGVAFERGNDKESNLEAVANFVKENGINYTVLYGGSTAEVRKQLPSIEGFSGFPTTAFINRAGKVVKVDVGFRESDAPELERTVRDLLGLPEP